MPQPNLTQSLFVDLKKVTISKNIDEFLKNMDLNKFSKFEKVGPFEKFTKSKETVHKPQKIMSLRNEFMFFKCSWIEKKRKLENCSWFSKKFTKMKSNVHENWNEKTKSKKEIKIEKPQEKIGQNKMKKQKSIDNQAWKNHPTIEYCSDMAVCDFAQIAYAKPYLTRATNWVVSLAGAPQGYLWMD